MENCVELFKVDGFRSRDENFEMHDQWSRLVTLEYTLQRLERCRQRQWARAA